VSCGATVENTKCQIAIASIRYGMAIVKSRIAVYQGF
jgi:hypothetical protein